MTQEQMRQKALAYIVAIRTVKADISLPELPADYEVTWETLGNLALILAGLRTLDGDAHA